MQQILNYAGLALGLLSIAATIYVAVRYSERKGPTAYIVSDRKIAVALDAPPMLEVRYGDRPIPTLTSTYIWFWNAGRKPIRREDIAPKTPVAVSIDEGGVAPEILEVTVRKVTRDSIAFTAIHTRGRGVELAFDFLDYEDGALVEVQHTGSTRASVSMSGVILGAPHGIRTNSRSDVSGGLPFLLPFVRDWSAAKRTTRRRRVMLVPSLALIWLLVFVVLETRSEITTTRILAAESLRGIVSPSQVPLVVTAIASTDRYHQLNATAFYLALGLALLMTPIIIWDLLRPRLSLPPTLALVPDPGRDVGKGNA